MGTDEGMRVLGRLRLSVSRDESTSIDRQREVIENWAAMNGHTVVGWAEDVDVSGSVDPFETAQLGPWLDHRAPEWDILCAWKLDRISRNAIKLNKLFGWCLDHDKSVVSCSESIDLSTPVGRLIANVIAFLAEGELEAIRERQKSSRAKLRQLARWPGGKPPYGYAAVRRPQGGYSLAVDPDAAAVVRRIVDAVLDGESLTRLARDLTAEGVRTPAQYYAAVRREKPGVRVTDEDAGGKWHPTPMRLMLRSRVLRGHVHHGGETVRDDAGMPLQIAEPLVTPDEWELIQAQLDRVQDSRRNARRSDSNPLTGVVLCEDCAGPLHHDLNTVKRAARTYEYRYYRCRPCSVMVRADFLEAEVEREFLAQLGAEPVRERRWVAGDSHAVELAEAITALDEIAAAAGKAKSAAAKQRLQGQLAKLDDRIAELESAPAREGRWEYVQTGKTYEEVWTSADTDERRALLVRSGITVSASSLAAHLNIPAGITATMSDSPLEWQPPSTRTVHDPRAVMPVEKTTAATVKALRAARIR